MNRQNALMEESTYYSGTVKRRVKAALASVMIALSLMLGGTLTAYAVDIDPTAANDVVAPAGSNATTFMKDMPGATIVIDNAELEKWQAGIQADPDSIQNFLTIRNNNFQYFNMSMIGQAGFPVTMPAGIGPDAGANVFYNKVDQHIVYKGPITASGETTVAGDVFDIRIPNVAILEDGSRGDVLVTFSDVHIFTCTETDKPCPTQEEWNALHVVALVNVDTAPENRGLQFDVADAMPEASGTRWHIGTQQSATFKVVQSGTNTPVNGTFIYPMKDVDIRRNNANYNSIYRADINDNFSETIRVDSGAASKIYTPATNTYNHIYKDSAGGIRFAANAGSDNDTYNSGFAVVANANGFRITGVHGAGGWYSGNVNSINTPILRGQYYHKIASSTTAGGTIQTTTRGNAGGGLNDGGELHNGGYIVVGDHKSVTYTMKPKPGYKIDKIVVDGRNVSLPAAGVTSRFRVDNDSNNSGGRRGYVTGNADGSYTFEFRDNIYDHAIHVSWVPLPAQLTGNKHWEDYFQRFRDDVLLHLNAAIPDPDGTGTYTYKQDFHLPAQKITTKQDGSKVWGSGSGFEAADGTQIPDDSGTKSSGTNKAQTYGQTTSEISTTYKFWEYDYDNNEFVEYEYEVNDTYGTYAGAQEYSVDYSYAPTGNRLKVDFLPKYDTNGNQIIYTVTEDPIKGYDESTETNKNGSLIDYPDPAKALFEYTITNTQEPVATVGIKIDKALDGRAYIDGEEYVFVLSGLNDAPMPIEDPAQIPGIGDDKPETVVQKTSAAPDTARTEVDFGLIAINKADLNQTQVGYGQDVTLANGSVALKATDAQKKYIDTWTKDNGNGTRTVYASSIPDTTLATFAAGELDYSDASPAQQGRLVWFDAATNTYFNQRGTIPAHAVSATPITYDTATDGQKEGLIWLDPATGQPIPAETEIPNEAIAYTTFNNSTDAQKEALVWKVDEVDDEGTIISTTNYVYGTNGIPNTAKNLHVLTVTYSAATDAQKALAQGDVAADSRWKSQDGNTTYTTDTSIPDDAVGTLLDNTFKYRITENPQHSAAVENDIYIETVEVYVVYDEKNNAILLSAERDDQGEWITGKDATVTREAELSRVKIALNPVSFRNVYDSTNTWTPTATKVLNGRPLERDQFNFKMHVHDQSDADVAPDFNSTGWVSYTPFLQARNINGELLYYNADGAMVTLADGGIATQPVQITRVQTTGADNKDKTGNKTLLDGDLTVWDYDQDVVKDSAATAKGTNGLYGPVTFDDVAYTNTDLAKRISYDGDKRVVYWRDGATLYGPIPEDATNREAITIDGVTYAAGELEFGTATEAQREAAGSYTADSVWQWTDAEGIVDPDPAAKGMTYTKVVGTILDTDGDGKAKYYKPNAAGKMVLTGTPTGLGVYYETERTFKYVMWEVKDASDWGLTKYDGDAYGAKPGDAKNIEVKIAESAEPNGTIEVTEPDAPVFENKYDAEGKVNVKVTKKMDQRDEFGQGTFPSGSSVEFAIEAITVYAPLPSRDGGSDTVSVNLPAGDSIYTLDDAEDFEIIFRKADLMQGDDYIASRTKDGLYERTFVYKITERVTGSNGRNPEDPQEGLQPGTDPKDPADVRNSVFVSITVQEDKFGNITVTKVNGADVNDIHNRRFQDDNIGFVVDNQGDQSYPPENKGRYDAESTVKAGTIYNTYQASGELDLEVTKELEGMDLAADMFYFELSNPMNSDHPVVDEQGNAADGRVAFDTIVYNLNQVRADADAGYCDGPGTEAMNEMGPWAYTYEIKELVPAGDAAVKGMHYDTHKVTVRVVVYDNGDGTLTAWPTYGGETTFTNKFETFDLELTKEWDDDELDDLAAKGYDRPKSVAVVVSSSAGDKFHIALDKDNSWTETLNDLPKYTYAADGAETAITYTITEVKPDGYKVTYTYNGSTGEVPVEIDASSVAGDDTTAEVTVTNTPVVADLLESDIVLHKIDSVTKENIEGVIFVLKNADGEQVGGYRTDEYGVAHINIKETYEGDDRQGAYAFTLSELSPLDGYEANTDEYEIVVKGGEVQNVELRPSNKTIFDQLYELIVGDPQSAEYDEANRVLTVKNKPEANNITVTKTFVDDDGEPLPDEVLGDFEIAVSYTGIKGDGSADLQDERLAIANGTKQSEGVYTWDINGVAYGTDVHVHEMNYLECAGYDFNGTQIAVSAKGAASHDDDTTFTMPAVDATVDFENTYVKQKGYLELVKNWNDENNRDGKRPDDVTFTVTASQPVFDGESTMDVTFNGDAELPVWTDETLDPLPLFYKGQQVTYRVDEADVAEYDKTIDQSAGVTLTKGATEMLSITNTYEPKTGSVKATKTWDDDDNEAGMRKATTAYLYADGLLVGEITEGNVTIEGGDVKTWEDLPVYTADGEDGTTKIKYTVKEAAVAGYTTSYDPADGVELNDNGESTIEIINTYDPEYVGLTVTKNWVDDDDADGFRPESLTIDVEAEYADESGDAPVFDGEAKKTITLDEAGNWTYTFADEELPKVHDGKAVIYTIDGTTEEFQGGNQDQYTHTCVERTTTGEVIVTNIHNRDIGCIEVDKVWEDDDDQDGMRDDVVLTLYANDEPAKYADGSDVPTMTIPAHTSKPQEAVWHNLPVHKDGEFITYTVEEAEIDGYTTTYSDPEGIELSGDGDVGLMTVTNTHESATVNVTVTKAWAGEEAVGDKYRVDPEIRLYGVVNGKAVYEADIQTIDRTAEGDAAKAEWTDLPKKHEGETLEWRAVETAIPGYTPTYAGPTVDPDTGDATIDITNTFAPLTEVSVTKEWDDGDNRDNSRGDVTYTLTAEPASALSDDYEVEKTVGQNEGWAASWADLPATVVEGDEEVPVLYTVEETVIPAGYTPRVEATSTPGVFKVVNTRDIDTIAVRVVKDWHGDTPDIRPDHVVYELMANGEPAKDVDGNTIAPYVALASDHYIADFSKLPKNDENGEAIVYTVVEQALPGYTTTYAPASGISGASGIIGVTNTAKTGKLIVTKTWNDESDRDGMRPSANEFADALTIYQDGKASSLTGTAVDNDDDTFTVTYENIPIYNALNQPITYMAIEGGIEGYTQAGNRTPTTTLDQIEGDIGKIGLSNEHTPEKVDVTFTKAWDDASNSDEKRPSTTEFAGMLALSADSGDDVSQVEPASVVDNGDNTFTVTYKDLYRFQNGGQPITYTTTEDSAAIVDEEYEVVTGSATAITDEASDPIVGGQLENKYDPEAVEVKVTKVWDDDGNHDGKRPGTVTINLVADGVEVAHATFSSSGDEWHHTFTQDDDGNPLPKKRGGYEIVYEVDEDTVAEYDDVVEPATDPGTGEPIPYEWVVTNSYDPDTTSITAEKVWDDDDDYAGHRPEHVHLTLMQSLDDGANWEKVEISGLTNPVEVAGTHGDHFTAHWNGLPVYGEGTQGQTVEVKYLVQEDEAVEQNLPDGYTASGEGLAYPNEHGIAQITNTYEPELIAVPATKVWADNNDADSVRPTHVTFQLYGDGHPVPGKTLTLTPAGVDPNDPNIWHGELTSLHKHKAGEEIVYTWKEIDVPDEYTASYSADGKTITNTHRPHTSGLEVCKAWNDSHNQDGKRPNGVTAKLMIETGDPDNPYAPAKDADGSVVQPVVLAGTLGSADYWTGGVWYDLPINGADGEPIKYVIIEDPEPADYVVTNPDPVTLEEYEFGFEVIVNTYRPKPFKLTATKIWQDNNDQDGMRDDVTLHLTGTIAGSAPIQALDFGAKTIAKSDASDGQPAGTAEWTNLPEYHDGKKIAYTLTEESLAGYTTTVSPFEDEMVQKTNDDDELIYIDGEGQETTDAFDDQGNPYEPAMVASGNKTATVTNSRTAAVSEVSVEKVWDDADNQDDKRTDVQVTLLADGQPATVDASGQQLTNPVTLATGTNHDADVTYTWENLSEYKDGEPIVYTVEEAEVTDYTTIVTGDAENGYTVTNKHTPEVRDVVVEKKWLDSDTYHPDHVTFQLTDADGAAIEGQSAIITEGDSWKHTFTGLSKYKAGEVGVEAEYSATETEITGYTASEATGAGTADNPIAITNTPELGTLTVEKTWDDEDNRFNQRPSEDALVGALSFTADGQAVTLTQDGAATTTGNVTTVTYKDVPVYNAQGKAITYAVQEGALPGYTQTGTLVPTTTLSGDELTGTLELTNKYDVNKIEVPVMKLWAGDTDADGTIDPTRPTSVEIKLMANGQPAKGYDGQDVANITLNADGNWAGKFTNLPKLDAQGEAITYTVDEVAVPAGYTKSAISVLGIDTIVNTYEAAKLEGTKTWVDGGKAHDNATEVKLVVKREGSDTPLVEGTDYHVDWSGDDFTIRGLQKLDEAGEEITYTVEEDASALPEGYEVSQDGTDITNTITGTVAPVGSKTWVEGEADDHGNTALDVQLWRKSDGGVDEQVADAVIEWEADEGDSAFTCYADDEQAELPKYDAEGYEYTYYVKEGSVPEGYTVSGEGTMDLTNTFDGASAEVDLDTLFTKVAKDMPEGVASQKFDFMLATEATAPAPESVKGSATVTNEQSAAETAVPITGFGKLTFTEAGEYKYTLAEKTIPGWTVDPGEIEITITVTDDNGTLTAEVSPDAAGRQITNTYQSNSVSSDPSRVITMIKKLDGDERELFAEEFYFWLVEDEDNEPSTGSTMGYNRAFGYISLNELTFTEPGTYKYELYEVPGRLPGITYDATTYTLVATVTGDAEGKLTVDWKAYADAEMTEEVDKCEFVNTYDKAEAEHDLQVFKKLTGRDMADGEFKNFKLIGPNVGTTGGVVGTATGTAGAADDGQEAAITWDKQIKFSFDDLFNGNHTLDPRRVYTYTLYEMADNPAVPGVTYDATVHTLTATIKPSTSNPKVLDVTWSPNMVSEDGKVVFTNTYEPGSTSTSVTDGGEGTTATVAVTKAMDVPAGQSHTLIDDEFLFEMLDDNNERVALGTNKADGTVHFAPITFTKDDMADAPVNQDGTRTKGFPFTIKEIAGNNDDLTYDSHELQVVAMVTDDGAGKLSVAWMTDESMTLDDQTFTNSMPVEPTEVSVLKVWAGDTDIDGTASKMRPEQVKVQLLANRQPAVDIDGDAIDEITLTAEDNWGATVTNLPKYDADGKVIAYTFEEVTVPDGYRVSYLDAPGQKLVVNTYAAVTIAGTKKWVDDGRAHNNSADVELVVTRYDADGTSNPKKMAKDTDYHVDWSGEADANFAIRGLQQYMPDGQSEYVYKVDEVAAEGYSKQVSGDAQSGYTITNTIDQAYLEIPVEKVWVGEPTGAVTVALKSGDETLDTHEFTEAGTYTFTKDNGEGVAKGYPKYQFEGDTCTEIEYTVEEAEGEGYTREITGDASGFTVTNTNTQKMTVYAKKVWEGDSSDTSKRAKVEFQLMQTVDGATRNIGDPQAATVDAAPFDALDSVSWTDLPRFVDGKAATYTIDEVAVPEGYGASAVEGEGTQDEPLVITNTLGDDVTEITVTKLWDDNNNQDGIRPGNDEATVTLTANSGSGAPDAEWDGKDATGATVNSIILNMDNNGTVCIHNLPAIDSTGAAYVYKVEEDPVDGYETTYESPRGTETDGTIDASGAVTIINTHTPGTTSVSATKVWDDASVESAPDLHTDVVLHLYGMQGDKVVYDAGEKTIAKDSGDEAVWENLPTHHYSSTPLTWAIVENAVFGFTTSYEWTDAATCVVTNTYTGPTTQISVDKTWYDDANRDGVRPSQLAYELWKKVGAEGAEEKVNEVTVDVAADGSAPYTWYDLPTVENKEQTVDEHTAPQMVERPATAEEAAAWTADIEGTDGETRTYTQAEAKAALNAGEIDQSAYEEIVWLKEGDPIAEEQEVEVPARTESTTPILYSVKEQEVAGYTTVIEAVAPGEFKAINTHELDTRDIVVKKAWSGDEDNPESRVDHIAFNLTGDGATPIHGEATELKGLVLSGDNEWTMTIHGLPVNQAGKVAEPIDYQVAETTTVEGYTSSVSDDGTGTFTITNTYDGYWTLKATKVWAGDKKDPSGRDDVEFHLIQVVGGAENDLGEAKTVATGETHEEDMTAEWTKLPKYVGGKSATYTVKEVEAPKGYTATYSDGLVEGDTISVTVTNTAKKITITYYDPLAPEGEREVVKEVIDRGGDEPPQPPDPVHPEDPDKVFKGWLRTVDGDGNVTYTAQYDDKDKIKITYLETDPETGETKEVIKEVTINKGDPEPPQPNDPKSPEGYTFGGWDRDIDEFGNVIYKTRWVKDPDPGEITVTYKNGGKTEKAETIKRGENEPAQPDGDKLTPPEGKEGATFGGWLRTVDKDGNVTYEAQWIEDPIIITYIDSHGPNGEKMLVTKKFKTKEEAEQAIKNGEIQPADPTHEGYDFAGWDLNFDETNGVFTMVSKFNEQSAEKVVTYIDPQTGEVVVKTVKTSDPDSVTPPPAPSHDGLEFVEWVKGVDAAGNIIWTAKYKPICPKCEDCKNSTQTVTQTNYTPATTTNLATVSGGKLPSTGDGILDLLIVGSIAAAAFGGVLVFLRRRAHDSKIARSKHS